MTPPNENARVAAGESKIKGLNDGGNENSKSTEAMQVARVHRPVLRLRKPPLAAVDYVRQRCVRWPLCLRAKYLLALLARRDGLPFTAEQFDIALSEITSSPEYLLALTSERRRYLPNGFPYGFVSLKAQRHAAELLAKIQVTK